jgi:C4-dicarboxylate-binding protein DctP
MKKNTSHLIIGIFLMLFAIYVNAQPTIIKVTLQLPESHPLAKNWIEFGKIIEEKSQGELKIKLFSSASLFKGNEVPKAVGEGAIEAGSAFLGDFANEIPAVEIISLPFLFKDEAHWKMAVAPNSSMRKFLDKQILQKRNAKVLWWQAYGRNIYLSQHKPIRLPQNLKGKKVRTYGKIQGWSIEAYQGIPMLIPGSKQYNAYNKNVIDIGMTGVSAVESRKLYEVMDYMTLSFDSAIEFIAIMNNDFFEKLPQKHQKIILQAAIQVEKKLRQTIYQEERNTIKRLQSKINVIELTKSEHKKWVKASRPVIQKFIQSTGDLGKTLIKKVR